MKMKNQYSIPVFKPQCTQEELKEIEKVLKSGWWGLGPKTKEFEEKFAEYIGVKYAVALNSATAALHLALTIADVINKEVITTPLTFISTNHAILYNQGLPVFADIQPDTLNIDPSSIKKLVTQKTKAVICVHYAGHPCDMDEIKAITKNHKLILIEDSAHACGAEYKNKKIGTFGDMACFSFQAVKNLATGDGGMLVTNSKSIYERLLKLRWLGINRDTWSREKKHHYAWQYDVDELGYKYHLNDILSAIGLAQLRRLEKMNRRRQDIFNMYNKAFVNKEWIKTPICKKDVKPSYHAYVIKCPARNDLNNFLQKVGISTGVHYYPNNMYKMYRRFNGDTPICNQIWSQLLTLPVYPDLKNAEVNLIIKEIKRFGERYMLQH